MALTYRQLSENHLSDGDLRSRIGLSALKYAVTVQAEASNTTGHAARVLLARVVMIGGPENLNERLQAAAVAQMTGLSGINPRLVTDAEIDTAVAAIWNAMAGV